MDRMIHKLDSSNIEQLNWKKYCDLLRFLSDTITSTDQKSIERILGYGNIHIFVYGTFENPLGNITCIIEPKVIHNGSCVAHIEDVVVHPCARGQKIATKLIQHAKEFARKQNCYKALLHCNPSLLEMYKSTGFSNENLLGMRCNLFS